jgi:hypothetical protein
MTSAAEAGDYVLEILWSLKFIFEDGASPLRGGDSRQHSCPTTLPSPGGVRTVTDKAGVGE